MKALLFPGDQQFWYETLRALGHTAYDGADVGEVVTTAQRITAGDYDSWYAQWTATAARTGIPWRVALLLTLCNRPALGEAHCHRSGRLTVRLSAG